MSYGLGKSENNTFIASKIKIEITNSENHYHRNHNIKKLRSRETHTFQFVTGTDMLSINNRSFK